jgi:hypothetical protein
VFPLERGAGGEGRSPEPLEQGGRIYIGGPGKRGITVIDPKGNEKKLVGQTVEAIRIQGGTVELRSDSIRIEGGITRISWQKVQHSPVNSSSGELAKRRLSKGASQCCDYLSQLR